jgi:hypothetical protein
MGISSDGQICYGVLLEEESEDFPWGNREFEKWYYCDILKFKHSFEAYDKEGNQLVEMTDKKISAYWKEYYDFQKKNTLPLTLTYYCSYDYPLFILAIQETVIRCARGDAIELALPFDAKPEWDKLLTNFILDYSIPTIDGKCSWWLTSLYG